MTNLNLDELLKQREEATGAEKGMVPFDYQGKTFTFRDPILLDDDELDELSDLQDGPDIAEFYMGAEQYDQFLEVGGTSNLFFMVFTQYMNESRDEVGGNPTRGNRSSRRAARRRKR